MVVTCLFTILASPVLKAQDRANDQVIAEIQDQRRQISQNMANQNNAALKNRKDLPQREGSCTFKRTPPARTSSKRLNPQPAAINPKKTTPAQTEGSKN